MKTIGVDPDNFLVYEGSGRFGHAVWPTPELMPATIADESSDELKPKHNNDLYLMPYIFIDDGYDPVSRVRKGRIYEKSEMQPNSWNVFQHPATPYYPSDIKVHPKSLATFMRFNFYPKLKVLDIEVPLIMLGSNEHFTIWSVIDIEASISGEAILFLKARKTIGVLPKINYDAIDEKYHAQIKDKLDRLADDIHKAGPDSIVDRAREAASALINAYLLEQGHISKHKDLGKLAKPLRELSNKRIASNCAETLAIFHSRTKHSEQENRTLRKIIEADAEYAIQSVVTILSEIGWSK